MNQEDKIKEIQEQIDYLDTVARSFQIQINELKYEMQQLRQNATQKTNANPLQNQPIDLPKAEKLSQEKEFVFQKERVQQKNTFNQSSEPKEAEKTFNLEDYIGGNLLGKVGILVLIIGLGVFVKYAIDYNLIAPLGRMILAYLAGIVLIGIAYWLKPTYKAFSAVLLSGGIATLYFTTYLGFVFFNLMPQLVAFGLMFLITVYAVWEAVRYNEEIIGIIGLIGAYAVPILIGGEGGNITVLFGYMTLLNVGVLLLAMRKDWFKMNGISFVLTWLIYLTWFVNIYEVKDFTSTFSFAIVFFIIFYFTLIAYQVLAKQIVKELILALVFVNALIFYGVGWAIWSNFIGLDIFWLTKKQFQEVSLTLFTLFNAFLHAGVAFYLWKKNLIDKQLNYVVFGLSVTFFTLAVPLFFDRELITALWTIEMILLFAVSKREKILFFEYLSYALTVLSVGSVLFCFHVAWISPLWFVEALILFVLFTRFESKFFEICSYILAIFSALSLPLYYVNEWLIYFWLAQALIFCAVSLYFNGFVFKNISFGILATAVFAALGNWSGDVALWNEAFRLNLIMIVGVALYLFLHVRFSNNEVNDKQTLLNASKRITIGIHFFLLTLLSNELTILFSNQNQDIIFKLGFSILWVVYAGGLIAYGIWQKRKYLRLTGFVLIGITLLKLFLVDLSYDSPLSVIGAFIGVGILLLLTGFLYQKYKHIILEEDEGIKQ